MKKHNWYSVKNLHFAKYKYQCIIAKRVLYDQKEIVKEKATVYKVELEDSITMWVFTGMRDYELN